MSTESAYDVVVIGGGPSGSTAALRAARRGLRVALLEGARHPRFHVGESFLPRNLDLLRELGVEDKLSRIPRVQKLGASFALGGEDELTNFDFSEGFAGDSFEAFNIERAPFDAMLFEAAREAGAEAVEDCRVTEILHLSEGDVAIRATGPGGERLVRASYLLDASGQATVLGRHLGVREVHSDLRKVAYFAHYRNVKRRSGEAGGYPIVIMCREGWFWLIPIDPQRTSLGLVADADLIKGLDVPASEMLAWGISRTPLMSHLTEGAAAPARNGVTADFSYVCRPFAGAGYFLVGDAATFMDPIFSTGVCLGMMTGVLAADSVWSVLREGASPATVRRRYIKYFSAASGIFFRFVRAHYEHSFREIFLQRRGPLEVHRAVISILSGNVFPKARWALVWRLHLMMVFAGLQRHLSLAPKRPDFSMLEPVETRSAEQGRCGG
jgi:flavin-dependent dehydrogenase